LPSLESFPSSCTGCGLTAPSSTGQRRRLPLRATNRIIEIIEFPRSSGRRRPCRDDSGGEIAPGFAMLKRANALRTLIHQRHPTPSCGGHVPTAERTLDPARMFTESLTPGPELENSLDRKRSILWIDQPSSSHLSALVGDALVGKFMWRNSRDFCTADRPLSAHSGLYLAPHWHGAGRQVIVLEWPQNQPLTQKNSNPSG
jgi:hypothetical protein